MGYGDTCRGGNGDGGGYAGNLFIRNTGFLQGQDLLSAPPENKGVAALEAADGLSLAGFFNDFGVDLFLGR